MSLRAGGSRTQQGFLLLALLVLAACQPPAPQPTTTPPAPSPAPPTEEVPPGIRPFIPAEALRETGVDVWHPWLGVEASLLESQTAEFNQTNEWGITVRTQAYSSYTELFDNATAALAGSQGPQAVIALPEHASRWDAGGHVTDLATYMADPTYGLAQGEVDDFPAELWNQEVVAERRLGVPAQRSAHFLTYNQSWARQLGFPKPPATAQEFRTQACAAHTSLGGDEDPANDGRGGWLVRTDSMTFLSWLNAFGGGVLDGGGYRFLSPKNLEATAFLKQLYDDNCAWVPQVGQAPAEAFAAREALFGTAAMEEFSEFGRAMATAENADEWTVLSFPGATEQGLPVYGSSFVVLKSTPEQQLASWLLIQWLLSTENQRRWVEATGMFPLRTSVREALGEYGRSHPQWASAVEQLPGAQMQPQLASWRQVRVMLGDGFEAMFRVNTPAGRVAEILAIMDRTARDLSE